MEREQAKQVLTINNRYIVALILEVIGNVFQTFHSDGSIWFRY